MNCISSLLGIKEQIYAPVGDGNTKLFLPNLVYCMYNNEKMEFESIASKLNKSLDEVIEAYKNFDK